MRLINDMDAIAKIHEFEKFGSILGLERMTALMHELGDPQDDLKCIHVAGTNGKGSVCKYIYEILQAQGYRTGLYTSPFLEVFNERIELDHEFISDEDLEEYTNRVLEKVKVITDRGEDSPTEFEVITAVAFLYFKEKAADYVVLEVGLGGIGDSTNIIKESLVSVITSISFDHTDRLGNTLEEIAENKAGIIKKGRPVITSAKAPEALEVFRDRAYDLDCELYETCDIEAEIVYESLTGTVFDVTLGARYLGLEISMLGEHQVENAICALKTVEALQDDCEIEISIDAIYQGLKKAKQIGRFEVMCFDPLIIIDGAHNADGARTLREGYEKLLMGKDLLMITGMLRDKDTEHIIGEFRSIADNFITTEPENPRKLLAHELKALIEEQGGKCVPVADIENAFKEGIEHIGEHDGLICAGSLYLIGKLRTLIRKYLETL
ncbi:MAG: bifunctional folylpolyglutamate synthase/dihydrofolate synthase [Clostridiales bacterium]|nr:bifunctional folylpolyglutamate synthase/dihydrofolate synthase [Clostridiales bacterium]